MTLSRLCLNMIVRNEAAIIERALSSVVDHIDYWAISDTGSTDNTKAVIGAYFGARGIPGEFHDGPFDNFERARNRALDFARQSAGTFDYLLLMDADMQLRVDDAGFRDRLGASAYQMEQRSSINYWNTRLLRRDMASAYRGVTHEYLDHREDLKRLNGAWFMDAADGANRPGKFERDIALLLKGLEAEPDNARYMYYLAQSYRDAGQLEQAVETYARRFEMGGWDEERWSAQLNEARCRLALGDEAGFIATASSAFMSRPQRAEPLHDLALYYRKQAQYEEAMRFCELASYIPWPEADRLFIERFVYDFGIRQEISISGFYCQSQKRKDLGRLTCNVLALDRQAPSPVLWQARRNLVFYARPAAELMPSWRAARLNWEAPDDGKPTNPSIARIEGQYQLIAKVMDCENKGQPSERVSTRNFLLNLDEELQPLSAREIRRPRDFPEPRFTQVRGFGDMRLFSRDGAMWVSATVRELTTGGWCEMVLGRVAPDADTYMLEDWSLVAPEGPRRHEKNWMPRVAGDGLRFVYACDPTRLVDEQGLTLAENVPDAALDHLRGGSQVIPFDGGWLALTHEVTLSETGRIYLHRFVWFDEAMRLARVSEAFIFNHRGIEFAAGLAWHADGDRLIISYGVEDCEAWLAMVAVSDVRGAIAAVGELAGEGESMEAGVADRQHDGGFAS